jgi:hypothetical protein
MRALQGSLVLNPSDTRKRTREESEGQVGVSGNGSSSSSLEIDNNFQKLFRMGGLEKEAKKVGPKVSYISPASHYNHPDLIKRVETRAECEHFFDATRKVDLGFGRPENSHAVSGFLNSASWQHMANFVRLSLILNTCVSHTSNNV